MFPSVEWWSRSVRTRATSARQTLGPLPWAPALPLIRSWRWCQMTFRGDQPDQQRADAQLVHAGDFNYPNSTGATDYLVNDIPDPHSLPDTIYFSDGTTARSMWHECVLEPVGPSGAQTFQVTANVTSGWDYIQIPDPAPVTPSTRSSALTAPSSRSATRPGRPIARSRRRARRQSITSCISSTTTAPGRNASATVVGSSASPSTYGQSVAFTVTVAATTPGGGTPGGTVRSRSSRRSWTCG